MIELKDINVTFHQDKKTVVAVDDVNLTVESGDIYGIIGYSGAGKSTLVRTINLLQRPTQGHIFVSGQELAVLSEKDLKGLGKSAHQTDKKIDLTTLPANLLREARKKIGMIFQHFNLMNSLSVFENVAFPLRKSGLTKEEITKKVRDLLDLVGLTEKENVYPNQLSGGQKQRVAIARALANDPTILLCDEATSALDPKTTYSILELLKQVNQTLGITIVIITHEMQVVKEICNKVAVMEDGKVIENGTILEIFTNPKNQLTKDFIDTATHINKGIETVLAHEALLNLKQGDVLAKISFVGASTGDPLIAILSKEYDISANILFGNIEIIQETPVGTLLVALSGEERNLENALAYIGNQGVTLEILEDLRGGY